MSNSPNSISTQQKLAFQKNKAARESFETVLSLIGEIPLDKINTERFWELLGKHCASQLGMILAPGAPMTDIEAARFEHNTISFGKYEGTPINEVPISYLCWIADLSFHAELQRYVNSDRGKQRIQDEDDGPEDDA